MKEPQFIDITAGGVLVDFSKAPREWLERVIRGECVGKNPDETACGRAYAALLLAEGP